MAPRPSTVVRGHQILVVLIFLAALASAINLIFCFFSEGKAKAAWFASLLATNILGISLTALFIWTRKVEWRWLPDILNYRIVVTVVVFLTDCLLPLFQHDGEGSPVFSSLSTFTTLLALVEVISLADLCLLRPHSSTLLALIALFAAIMGFLFVASTAVGATTRSCDDERRFGFHFKVSDVWTTIHRTAMSEATFLLAAAVRALLSEKARNSKARNSLQSTVRHFLFVEDLVPRSRSALHGDYNSGNKVNHMIAAATVYESSESMQIQPISIDPKQKTFSQVVHDNQSMLMVPLIEKHNESIPEASSIEETAGASSERQGSTLTVEPSVTRTRKCSESSKRQSRTVTMSSVPTMDIKEPILTTESISRDRTLTAESVPTTDRRERTLTVESALSSTYRERTPTIESMLLNVRGSDHLSIGDHSPTANGRVRTWTLASAATITSVKIPRHLDLLEKEVDLFIRRRPTSIELFSMLLSVGGFCVQCAVVLGFSETDYYAMRAYLSIPGLIGGLLAVAAGFRNIHAHSLRMIKKSSTVRLLVVLLLIMVVLDVCFESAGMIAVTVCNTFLILVPVACEVMQIVPWSFQLIHMTVACLSCGLLYVHEVLIHTMCDKDGISDVTGQRWNKSWVKRTALVVVGVRLVEAVLLNFFDLKRLNMVLYRRSKPRVLTVGFFTPIHAPMITPAADSLPATNAIK